MTRRRAPPPALPARVPMTRIGPRQRALLAISARPGTAFILANPVTRSLCRRGLMAECAPDAFVHITAAGLRALADEADAGRLALAPKLPEKEPAP